ncbi:diacylglycerol/lipid kinase family protein [Anaerosphaera multitolerans]|uniref:Diacylglycerol kinase family lipid kinase n=1 Tax=Anaerosphaera multitolerans TaxID=2487351 RepID=A0A437S4U5_9FIRM|nr:diacylglycerol kinase family protein [Anaerosphaera multitolerans]RVU54031.1 diacylglycerol kinase family lipid kinase [Anaerosphaera multitolerans]
MEKIKIIANPKSGKEQAINKINALISLFSQDGYKIDLRFTTKRGDAMIFAEEDDGEDLIISVGGDGTLNEVVNGLYKSKRDVPLAILQAGTVNDFANVLKIPNNIRGFYEMIKRGKIKKVDLGMAGDRVFVNVAAGGMFTNIAYQVPEEKKTLLGRMAYYIEGVKELTKLGNPEESIIEAKINCEELNTVENVLMFIIANSASVGGFRYLAPDAEVFDGYLDVLIVKELELYDIPLLLPSILNGTHTEHDKVIYLKTKEITIESNKDVVIDVDGEKTESLPMTFKILEKALNLVVN